MLLIWLSFRSQRFYLVFDVNRDVSGIVHVISFILRMQKESFSEGCNDISSVMFQKHHKNMINISPYDQCTRIIFVKVITLIWTDHWVSELNSVTESVTESFFWTFFFNKPVDQVHKLDWLILFMSWTALFMNQNFMFFSHKASYEFIILCWKSSLH